LSRVDPTVIGCGSVQAEEEFEVAHGVGLGAKHVSKKEVSKFHTDEAGE
jgi:hypothetical protein